MNLCLVLFHENKNSTLKNLESLKSIDLFQIDIIVITKNSKIPLELPKDCNFNIIIKNINTYNLSEILEHLIEMKYQLISIYNSLQFNSKEFLHYLKKFMIKHDDNISIQGLIKENKTARYFSNKILDGTDKINIEYLFVYTNFLKKIDFDQKIIEYANANNFIILFDS